MMDLFLRLVGAVALVVVMVAVVVVAGFIWLVRAALNKMNKPRIDPEDADRMFENFSPVLTAEYLGGPLDGREYAFPELRQFVYVEELVGFDCCVGEENADASLSEFRRHCYELTEPELERFVYAYRGTDR